MRNLQQCRKCLIALCSTILLLSGCSAIKQEDMSGYAVELLQSVTIEFIDSKGIDKGKRLITIDISEFQELAIEKYEEWLQDSYANEDTVLVVFTDNKERWASSQEAKDYLSQNGYNNFVESEYDWTSITISRKSEKEYIHRSEVINIDISYPFIRCAEGFEVRMEYGDAKWKVIEVASTYIS